MRVLIAAAFAALLAGCGSSAPSVLPTPTIDVATAEMQAFKADTDIADCEKQTAEPVADGLPDVDLPCLGGGPDVALARLRGPLVVNLWAQWCPPCQRELPIYQAFHEKYGDRVGVLGVDWQDTQPGLALRMAADAGVTYPQVADTAPAIKNMALPKLILIDAQGGIAFEDYVEIKDLAQLEGLVEQHLGVSTR